MSLSKTGAVCCILETDKAFLLANKGVLCSILRRDGKRCDHCLASSELTLVDSLEEDQSGDLTLQPVIGRDDRKEMIKSKCRKVPSDCISRSSYIYRRNKAQFSSQSLSSAGLHSYPIPSLRLNASLTAESITHILITPPVNGR